MFQTPRDQSHSSRHDQSQASQSAAGRSSSPQHSGALLQRAAKHPASLTAGHYLQLQKAFGNRAVSQLIQRAAVVQRALNDDQKQEVRERVQTLNRQLDQALAIVPEFIRQLYAGEHPTQEPMRAVMNSLNDAGADKANIDTRLDDVQTKLNAFRVEVTGIQENLEGIGEINRVFHASKGEKLDTFNKALRNAYKDLLQSKTVRLVWDDLYRKMQVAVIPSNKEMQKLRAQNAGDAVNELGRLIQAGFVRVGSHKDFYESPFDNERDHFGGEWLLTPNADTGTMQWLNDWVFHIHGVAERMGPAMPGVESPVSGFHINRGHVKPVGKIRALGVSILIDNEALLRQVETSTHDKFIRWATSPEGKGILSAKKRNKF